MTSILECSYNTSNIVFRFCKNSDILVVNFLNKNDDIHFIVIIRYKYTYR